MANKKSIASPASKMKEAVAFVLQKNGYIDSFSQTGEGVKKEIVVKLKYQDNLPALSGVQIHSKPGRRVYTTSFNIPWGRSPKALFIISTSSGLLSQREAQVRHLGGEVIAEIW